MNSPTPFELELSELEPVQFFEIQPVRTYQTPNRFNVFEVELFEPGSNYLNRARTFRIGLEPSEPGLNFPNRAQTLRAFELKIFDLLNVFQTGSNISNFEPV